MAPATQESSVNTAPVEIDGVVLFRVLGIDASPASSRAAAIAASIEALGADRSFDPEALRAEERGNLTVLAGGSTVVMMLSDPDARMAGVERELLAMAYLTRIRDAVAEYRAARSTERLIASAVHAALAVVLAAVVLALLFWIGRRAELRLTSAFDRRTAALAAESRKILRVERIAQALRGVLGAVRVASVLFVVLFLSQYVLARFPWTRGAANSLFEATTAPVFDLARSAVAAIPKLLVLAILYLIVRYVLSLARLYFDALERGTMRWRDFEPEWAQPTFQLVRVAIVAAALVIAYPYIPGSDSEAFKGISILVGVLVSLGSSTAIANIVGGYMILYRRAFRIGDRVAIGDAHGHVTELRMQATHVRTGNNEELVIPNSTVLSSQVINFTKPARDGKLIMHTEVNLGYQIPWRQAQALLLEAARRTRGLLQTPAPFVLQKKLGEFAVTYELNAYSASADEMRSTYAELHGNVLDVFNEHGVQIMTPSYEGDPETPKIVAKEHWFTPPAKPAE